jgi:hypothetical protein
MSYRMAIGATVVMVLCAAGFSRHAKRRSVVGC